VDSHTSVYRYVWEDKRRQGTLWKYLRRKRKKYGNAARDAIPIMDSRPGSIEERPAIVAAQAG